MIAYASRSLSPSERNYPAHKLEFLALKWAITDKFHEYLYGAKFQVFTDNNPLTYVLTTAKLDATGIGGLLPYPTTPSVFPTSQVGIIQMLMPCLGYNGLRQLTFPPRQYMLSVREYRCHMAK